MAETIKKHSVSIDEQLYQEIKDYCELNDLKINHFVEEILRKQFLIEKYGDTPFSILSKKIEIEPVPPEIADILSDVETELIFDNESEKSNITDFMEATDKSEVKEDVSTINLTKTQELPNKVTKNNNTKKRRLK